MTPLRLASRLRVRACSSVVAALVLSALTFAQQPAPPGPPPQLPQELLDRDARRAELAAEAAQRGPVTPIPLLNGSRIVGVVYDQYLIGVVVGRSQIAGGRTADARTITTHPTWQSRGTVIVAYPLDCDGKPNQPLAIRWTSPLGAPVQPEPIAGPMPASNAQSLLPGVAIPERSLVVNLRNAFMLATAAVEVDYAAPVCRGAARTAPLPIAVSPNAMGLARAGGIPLKLPAELASLSPSTVRVQLTLDATGRPRFPRQVQGPPELLPLVLAYLNSQSYPPPTTNGVAMPLDLMPAFVFTVTGDPAPPAPFVPPGSAAGVRSVTTTSMVAVPSTRAPTPSTPVPPAPPGQTDLQLARLAIEIAAKGEPVPIPFDAAGSATRGVIFDRFLIAALRARAAVNAGTPPDPATASADQMRDDLIAVAFPLVCEGRTIAPDVIEMTTGGTQPGPVPQRGSLLTGPVLRERLPSASLPEGAIGQAFVNRALNQNLEVRVTYHQPVCGSTGKSLSFPIQWTAAQSLPRLSTAKLPSGSSLPSPTPVRLRGVVDFDGAYRFPTLADGPAELTASAVVSAAPWKFQPGRANGVVMPVVMIMPLTFTTSGMPEVSPANAPPSAAAPPVPPQPGSGPPIVTSSTIGGRSTVDFTTEAVPGLTAATSKCEIATDTKWGFSAASPVKIGGSFAQGPVRQRQFLSALRGPSGEGMRIIRRGSTMAPDKQTILDVYDVTYAGLAAPLQIYVDQYHEDTPLRAPSGFTCAAPVIR